MTACAALPTIRPACWNACWISGLLRPPLLRMKGISFFRMRAWRSIILRALATLALPAMLLQACVSSGLPPPVAAGQAVPARSFAFGDGGEAIYFTFDKRLHPGPSAPTTYLFVIAGSDCASMQPFLPQYFRGLEGESGSVRIFILHKRHIRARVWARLAGCSDDFIRDDHPQRWIADQGEFIAAQLMQARQAGALPRRVALVGISEGGDIVPVLAQRNPEVTHAAILANGGMDPLDAYRLQAQRRGFTDGLAALKALEGPPPADPDDAAVRIHGRSYRYWSELRALRHTDALASLSMPLLVAMGEADAHVPIDSLRYLQQHFAALGKTNLTALSYPQADHGLRHGDHSYLPEFWFALDNWLAK